MSIEAASSFQRLNRRELLRTAAALSFTPFLNAGNNDPHRPRYHFLPVQNWMNDPNGLIYWKGQYHLFYQYNPNGAFWGTMHWGHAVSPDMIHWKHLPIALAPTPGGYDKDGVFSGCAVIWNGKPTIVYTATLPETQCLATSEDMITWKKYQGNPVIAGPPPGLKVAAFRDPCVWREGEDWMMAIGSGIEGGGGAVLLYQSKELTHWNYLHPLLLGELANDGPIWECPSFFKLGGKHVLLVSLDKQSKVMWMTGSYKDRKFIPEKRGILDEGGYYYAPQTMLDAAGRRVIFGWLPEGRTKESQKDAGWCGVQAIPRILTLRSDNSLGYAPIEGITKLRGKLATWRNIDVAGETQKILSGVHGDSLEIMVELEPDAAEFGVRLRASPDGAEETLVIVDQPGKRVNIDRRKSSLSETTDRDVKGSLFDDGGKAMRLRVLLDRSVVEVFANDSACVTSRIYPSKADSLGFDLFARGGGVRVKSLSVWEMRSIWS